MDVSDVAAGDEDLVSSKALSYIGDRLYSCVAFTFITANA